MQTANLLITVLITLLIVQLCFSTFEELDYEVGGGHRGSKGGYGHPGRRRRRRKRIQVIPIPIPIPIPIGGGGGGCNSGCCGSDCGGGGQQPPFLIPYPYLPPTAQPATTSGPLIGREWESVNPLVRSTKKSGESAESPRGPQTRRTISRHTWQRLWITRNQWTTIATRLNNN